MERNKSTMDNEQWIIDNEKSQLSIVNCQLIIGDLSIDVVRKDIKNIHLAVYPPTGRVRLAAPFDTDADALRLFVISKLSWIKKQQRGFMNQKRMSIREYKQRESHYFQGRRYLLNIIEEEATPKVVLRSKRYIDLHVRPLTSTAKRHEILTEWYRAQLKMQIPLFIEKWSNVLNVQVNDWQVRQMKTKWASCNIEKKRITINLELAKKPITCLEYVIVHELVHLLERHHNDRFLHYMNKYLPNWRKIKTELNDMPLGHADWSY